MKNNAIKKQEVKTVACYCRVSHEEQVIKNLSIPSQQKDLTAYCKQNNYVIHDFYIDEGLTATNAKRPGLTRLLDNLDKFDLVLFTKLDRFSRNILDANLIDQELKKHNVSMVAINEDDIDTSTADGRFMFNLKLNLAQREAEKTGERIKDVFKYKVEILKEAISGSVPIGYKLDNKHYVIDEDTVDLVKQSFDLCEELMSARAALIRINEMYNLKISHRVFYAMLKNKIYLGIYESKKKNYYCEDFCEPIVSKEQFASIQRILKSNKKYSSVNRSYDYIFSGLLKCKECGKNMCGIYAISQNKEIYYYYRCNTYMFFKNKRCIHKKRASQKKIEDYLLHNISSILNDYLYNISITQKANDKNKKNKIDINNINKKLEKLRDLYLDDMISKKHYSDEYKKLNALLNQAIKEKEELSKDKKIDTTLLNFISNNDFEKTYNNFDSTQKKRFWASFINYITVDKDNNLEVYFL